MSDEKTPEQRVIRAARAAASAFTHMNNVSPSFYWERLGARLHDLDSALFVLDHPIRDTSVSPPPSTPKEKKREP